MVTTLAESVLDWCVEAVDRKLQEEATAYAAAERAAKDLISVAVCGRAQPAVAIARSLAAETGATGRSPIWSTDRLADPVSAAFVNGTAAQALDYDDVAPEGVAHLSSIIVPCVAALADRIDPVEHLPALARGYAIAARLARLMGRPSYDAGLQPTHTLGTLGAVGALLFGLRSPTATRRAAFSLVASQLIGLRAHTGSRYKAMQAGIAAAGAVRAVLLAQRGMEGGVRALDDVLNRLGADTNTEVLGEKDLAPAFLGAKFIPTCGGVHTAVEATLAVRSQLDDSQRASSTLSVRVPPRINRHMHFLVPANPDEARFSVAYCVAGAWVLGHVTPPMFTETAITDPRIVDVIPTLRLIDDSTMAPNGDEAVVEATGPFGTVSHRVDHRFGYPRRVPTDSDMRRKFVDCLSSALGAQEADALYERARSEQTVQALQAAVRVNLIEPDGR
ncbi:MAG: MmgE/PrpD family protein [Streptosporangiaceae bacterium]